MKREVTLRYVATGNSFSNLQHFYTLAKFIPSILKGIFDSFEDHIMFILFLMSHSVLSALSFTTWISLIVSLLKTLILVMSMHKILEILVNFIHFYKYPYVHPCSMYIRLQSSIHINYSKCISQTSNHSRVSSLPQMVFHLLIMKGLFWITSNWALNDFPDQNRSKRSVMKTFLRMASHMDDKSKRLLCKFLLMLTKGSTFVTVWVWRKSARKVYAGVCLQRPSC